jgi:PAS domain S-box-containing protein
MENKESPRADEWPAEAVAAGGECGEALRESERQFQQSFGHAPCGMIATSLKAGQPVSYLAVNAAFCELTGYSRQELGGRDFLGDIHPDDQPRLESMIEDVISGAASRIRADMRVVRKDGEVVSICLDGSAIQPPAGERYLAAFVEDVTSAEQSRAAMRQLERELAESRRLQSLGQLVGGIAHDFSNLLTVIGNYASLVRDEVSVAEATENSARWEPVRWDVEQIGEAADRAKRLIQHLLAFARKEMSQPVLIDLSSLIGDVTGLLDEVLGEHIAVAARPGAGLWPVEADTALLEQAIINILVNARDAMPSGGQVTIDTINVDTRNASAADRMTDPQDAAELSELLPGRYVGISITDTGVGMDPVIAERAFESFFSTKSGDQAAGLGLPAVRRFAAQAGGKAWLRSQPGTGTSVTLILPAASETGPATAGTPGAGHGESAQAGTVLVVDDEPAIRQVAQRVLVSAGYRVVTAQDGPEALRLLGDPDLAADLVLADVVMPGMTAQVFAARTQAVSPGIRVLFMSGYERPDETTAGWPDAHTQIICKPFSRAALLARVTEVMAAQTHADMSASEEMSAAAIPVRRR